MSPLPEQPLSSPNPSASADPANLSPDHTGGSGDVKSSDIANPSAPDSSNAPKESTIPNRATTEGPALELKRPVMRPVRSTVAPVDEPKATPQPPPTAEIGLPKAMEEKPTASSPATEVKPASRFQPIPPPSEPKQYRAIGLVRGRYTPSEEQFTRGEMTISDGTLVEAVLLGRIMSLVKNHLDLTQEHLWVVYPRTRIQQKDLHIQVVGVWEPERLQKELLEQKGDLAANGESEASAAAESVKTISGEENSDLTPGYDDDYFSIRGEVLTVEPEEELVIVKIQQSPKKGTEKAKAFKLHLKGTLPSPKTVGYFWDFHVRREATSLTIMESNVVGLVPPKKKKGAAASFKKGGRPFKKRFDGSGGGKPRPSGATPNRPPVPKPAKRNEPSSEN